ncbi:MAG: hypothetical protein ABSD74_07250 [Rhizomicrobium sp.]|jgi:hypothetical protein
MKLGEQAIAGVLGILACAGLIWGAIGFAGYALMTSLSQGLGSAGAAAVTAVILLIVPVAVVALSRRSTPEAESDPAKGADSVLSAIAKVAKERPFLAMIGAALFGIVEVYLNQQRKKK